MGRTSLPNQTRRAPLVGNGSEQLAQGITRLLAFDVPALRQKWATLLRANPWPHLGRAMMIRAIIPAPGESVDWTEILHAADP